MFVYNICIICINIYCFCLPLSLTLSLLLFLFLLLFVYVCDYWWRSWESWIYIYSVRGDDDDSGDYSNSDGIGKCDVNVTVLQLHVRSFVLLVFFFSFVASPYCSIVASLRSGLVACFYFREISSVHMDCGQANGQTVSRLGSEQFRCCWF